MRRRTVWIILSAAVVTAIVVAGVVVWFRAESREDALDACKKAVAAHDFDAHPIAEGGRVPGCEDVGEDEYMGLIVANAIDDMPKDDKELLDYSDDGSLNGSIG